jgi:hypothetical protein
MISSIFPFETGRIALDKNVLLHSEPSGSSLEQVKAMKKLADLGQSMEAGKKGQLNLAKVSEHEIEHIHKLWGESGLLQLLILAMSLDAREFEHFYGLTRDTLRLGSLVDGGKAQTITYDNDSLAPDRRLNVFASNVLNPSLSRKLYHAGRHHGSLVYGLGGPRILVSHPFQGIDRDIYDIYANSIDVVTSLNLRGYHGTFHFLDYVGGLDYEVAGFPAWAIWFAVIATHSDLVLFVKEFDGEFGKSQQLEISLTPDRVRKKIVEIPHIELSWAKKAESTEGLETMYVTDKGRVSEEEWNRMEASHAEPFVTSYVGGGFPSDCLIVLREDLVEEYPLDFPVYDADARLRPASTRVLPTDEAAIGDAASRVRPSRTWWQFWKK